MPCIPFHNHIILFWTLFKLGLDEALKWSAIASELVFVPTEITSKREEAINQSGQFLIK